MRRFVPLALLVAWAPHASAQEVFHSTQAANLPTATVMPRGSWLFEISHRFDAPLSNGASDLWGLDGPAYNRLGLTYSVSDQVALGVLRSNVQDNVELDTKVRVWSAGGDAPPVAMAVMAGVAWNTQVFEVDGAEDNEMQLYAQLIVDVLLARERVALGIVPTYLRNPRLRDFREDDALALGLHGAFYATDALSLLVEWLISEERPEQENDAATFGLQIETRGHFFKLVLTNQARLNPTQFLGGTPTDFEPGEWRFGFNIQRLLPF